VSGALVLDQLIAGYGKVRILQGVDLEIGDDRVRAILGPNGSGKSTLLKTMMGLTRIHGGDMRWGEVDLLKVPVHKRVAAGFGYVPQNDNVFPGLSVDANLRMGGFLLPRAEVRSERERVIELFPQLRERLGTQGASLSGGERRLLSMAMTLMARPRVLLLDEPTSDLAPAAIDVVFECIAAIRREYRVPIVLVEQNVPRALNIADHVTVLVAGTCRMDKRPDEIEHGELERLFLG